MRGAVMGGEDYFAVEDLCRELGFASADEVLPLLREDHVVTATFRVLTIQEVELPAVNMAGIRALFAHKGLDRPGKGWLQQMLLRRLTGQPYVVTPRQGREAITTQQREEV